MDRPNVRPLPTPADTSVFISAFVAEAPCHRFSDEIQIHHIAADDPNLAPRVLELLDAGFAVVLRTNTGWEQVILPRRTEQLSGDSS